LPPNQSRPSGGVTSLYNKLTPAAAVCSVTEEKPKVHPITCHEGSENGERYVSTLPLTSTLDGDGWSTQGPGRLTPKKETWYPIYMGLGLTQIRSGRVWKVLPTSGFYSQVVQLVESWYTDYAIWTHTVTDFGLNLLYQLVYLLVSVKRIMGFVNLAE
jgi:hypothetical protein